MAPQIAAPRPVDRAGASILQADARSIIAAMIVHALSAVRIFLPRGQGEFLGGVDRKC